MKPVALSQLAGVVQGTLAGSDITVNHLLTDSRQISTGSLFVALQGDHFDGHDFASQAQTSGAVALLVNRQLHNDLPQLIVADTRKALGQIAAWWRQQLSVQTVALTGSSGKTTVKEMTAAILRQCGTTLSTEGNFNNDIGVPLTLLRLKAQHQFAVIELGANHIGEIHWTTSLVRPQAVLINNLAAAHLAGFGSLQGVAQAKGEIFAGLTDNGIAIINNDSQDLALWQSSIGTHTLWRFSAELVTTTDCDFFTSQVQLSASDSKFMLHTPAGSVPITLPLPGQHNLANALAAAALASAVGAPLAAIQQGLAQMCPIAGRLFPLALGDDRWLIDDSYNANVSSMQAAIAVLAAQPGYRILVAGDMAELGEHSVQCHQQIGKVVRQAAIDKVLTTGTDSQLISKVSGCGEHFSDKTALLNRLSQLLLRLSSASVAPITVLIKGSRSAAMDQLVQALLKNEELKNTKPVSSDARLKTQEMAQQKTTGEEITPC